MAWSFAGGDCYEYGTEPVVAIAPQQGDLLVAMLMVGAASQSPTISDSEVNSWTPFGEQMPDDGHGDGLFGWWAIAKNGNATNVTIANIGGNYCALGVGFYRGGAASPADGDSSLHVTNDGTTDHIASGPWNTTAEGDLLVSGGLCASNLINANVGTGFAERAQCSDPAGYLHWEDKLTVAQGSVEGTWTLASNADQWTTIAAAFKVAGEAPPASIDRTITLRGA